MAITTASAQIVIKNGNQYNFTIKIIYVAINEIENTANQNADSKM